MRALLHASPTFAPQWQAFQAEWREEADDLPYYLVLDDFARHLIGMLERGDTADLPAVFAVGGNTAVWDSKGELGRGGGYLAPRAFRRASSRPLSWQVRQVRRVVSAASGFSFHARAAGS